MTRTRDRRAIEALVYRLRTVERLDYRAITARAGISRDAARKMLERIERKIYDHWGGWVLAFRAGATIDDIAERAGVHRHIVERVIATSPRVGQ